VAHPIHTEIGALKPYLGGMIANRQRERENIV